MPKCKKTKHKENAIKEKKIGRRKERKMHEMTKIPRRRIRQCKRKMKTNKARSRVWRRKLDVSSKKMIWVSGNTTKKINSN